MEFERLQQQINFDITDRLHKMMHSYSEKHLDPSWIQQKGYEYFRQRKITWLCEGFSIDLTVKPKPRWQGYVTD